MLRKKSVSSTRSFIPRQLFQLSEPDVFQVSKDRMLPRALQSPLIILRAAAEAGKHLAVVDRAGVRRSAYYETFSAHQWRQLSGDPFSNGRGSEATRERRARAAARMQGLPLAPPYEEGPAR